MTSSEPLASHLADNYGWDEQAEGCNIWSIAPRGSSAPNLLVDRTQGVQYLEETKDGVVTGFQHVARDVSAVLLTCAQLNRLYIIRSITPFLIKC